LKVIYKSLNPIFDAFVKSQKTWFFKIQV